MLTEEPILSSAQASAIPALLSNKTIIAAAEEAGVSERTIRRWLAADVNFQREYNRARRAAVRQSVSRLQRLTTDAADTVERILKYQDAAKTAQVAAIRLAFDFAMRGIEEEDILIRMEDIEKSTKEREEPPPAH